MSESSVDKSIAFHDYKSNTEPFAFVLVQEIDEECYELLGIFSSQCLAICAAEEHPCSYVGAQQFVRAFTGSVEHHDLASVRHVRYRHVALEKRGEYRPPGFTTEGIGWGAWRLLIGDKRIDPHEIDVDCECPPDCHCQRRRGIR